MLQIRKIQDPPGLFGLGKLPVKLPHQGNDAPGTCRCLGKILQNRTAGIGKNLQLPCQVFLAGIPGEYHPHLVELPSATAQEIANSIKKVAQMSGQEQEAMGKKAKAFVLENKNKYAQAKKIVAFTMEKDCKDTE